MSVGKVLLQQDSEGVATIILNRPDVHNAFDDEVVADLMKKLDQVAADEETRVVVITSRGQTFSAGADVEWMKQAAGFSEEENFADARLLGRLLYRLNSMPLPTIALVQGSAFGGGVGLIAACDIAVAVKSAKFAFSEVRLGLTPATISPYVISAIGTRQARRYFITGESFDAKEAKRMGLVHIVVTDGGEMLAARDRLLRHIHEAAPKAARAAKDLVAAVRARPVDDAMIEDTALRIATRRASAEGIEGLSAFLDKRKPEW
ncbi:MAG TPA: enoyl-CoA hydratase-related protein [Alphaproteobacteria bacterium]|jgi:methylglutaconyl-CoA hydratase|nr:enoyl-CoA hydratase-related protein [Alphaproteobacteria bacterium]MDP7164825.1 enoyl-CoA hydratase-related protein [Alphaproteobacteria bacterium]MDP7427568.1 enoyl-CoA hydratase-related protein [Alphaproteobacteria bacterium]HJM51942.1 enoyl-CoA hydratase-related protein [Alphaproteobacteria bacterium]